jgi:hypothetical protein
MRQTVFYGGLDDFCRTYLVTNRQVTPAEFGQFPDRMEEQRGSIFEELMLFDKVSFKVYGENIQSMLLDLHSLLETYGTVASLGVQCLAVRISIQSQCSSSRISASPCGTMNFSSGAGIGK